jgi:hypothetical protein
MKVGDLLARRFKVGDLVTRRSHENDVTFCIIGFKTTDRNERVAVLKALFNHTFIVEAPVTDLVNMLVKGKL